MISFIGYYNYTVILTYISLFCSIAGMLFTVNGWYKMAVLCLALSGLCDMFDGKIARRKTDRTDDEKCFGIQIDSLCDMVCFGAFPILLAYSLGMRGPIGIVILAWYGMNGVVRLGYFNVCETKRQEETEEVRKYYSGLPITSIAVVLPLVFVLHTVLCLALSGLCDMFDGKIARRKTDRTDDEKCFGIQIDSLCDMVCFGAFPILLAYSLGMRGPIGIVILAWYGMNGVVRLGYFNVCETKRQEETEEVRKYYSGLPITSIAVVLPLVFVLHTVLRNHFAVALHVAMFVVGTLFVTNIQVKKPRNSTLAVLVGVVALAILKIFHIF